MSINFGSATNHEFETNTNGWTNVVANQIDTGDTVSVRIWAMARKQSNGDCAYWFKQALFRRDDTDPVTLIGAVLDVVTPIKTLGAVLWDFRIRVEDDEYIYIDVKGASGANVGWFLGGDALILDYPTE